MPKQLYVELDQADCCYLLDLIKEMDMETAYTARQRGYTIPKLEAIYKDPSSKRLAYQDIEYLLDLVEDDDESPYEQQRLMTQEKLVQIQELQAAHAAAMQDIETQRANRKARRQPVIALQNHFERTDV
jgi:hypothetical protein